MLKIRFTRTGKTNTAHFRVVVAEHRWAAKGKFLEVLGNYNPRTKELNVKQDLVKEWMSKGAQLSPTVHNLFVSKGIISDTKKVQAWRPKVTEEKKKAAAEAAKAAQASAATEEKKEEAPAPEPAPAEEAPAETPAPEAPKEEAAK